MKAGRPQSQLVSAVSPPSSYPQAVMDKISEMGEGIVVKDGPMHKTTKDGILSRGKRGAAAGEAVHTFMKNNAHNCIYC